MYCSQCGVQQNQQTKFCKQCGAQLARIVDQEVIDKAEDRLREELVDLFWVTVVGLGIILGGLLLIKKILGLSEGIAIGFLVLSSLAFATNFALSLWQIVRLAGQAREVRRVGSAPAAINLRPVEQPQLMNASPSVTESTTRNLDTAPQD